MDAHLTAHEPKVAHRIADYYHIVRTLLFPPLPGSPENSKAPTTMYSTSHLFILGDLNFRVVLPPSHPLLGASRRLELSRALDSDKTREELKEFDQLIIERRKGTVFIGLREGEFWRFKCSYKYHLGEVDKYRFAHPSSFSLYTRSRTLIVFTAPREARRGQIGYCTPSIRTHQIPQTYPKSPTCCILLFLRIPHQITYVQVFVLSIIDLSYASSIRNRLYLFSYFLHHHPPKVSHSFAFQHLSNRLQTLTPCRNDTSVVRLTG